MLKGETVEILVPASKNLSAMLASVNFQLISADRKNGFSLQSITRKGKNFCFTYKCHGKDFELRK